MAKYADARFSHSTMDASTEILTLNLDVTFFDTDGSQVVTEGGTVQVAVSPSHGAGAIHAAMVDAIVAYADSVFSWTVPREHVTHPQIARGS